MSSRKYISPPELPAKPQKTPAVKVGNLVFCSGQSATGPIKQATLTALRNILTVLEYAGSDLYSIVKVNIYLATMDDYQGMNEVYMDFLPKPYPARTCVSPSRLPNNAVFEVDCVAEIKA